MSARTPVTLQSGRIDAERADRRIQRSREPLHEALGSLIREKPYDGSAVVSKRRFVLAREIRAVYFRPHNSDSTAISLQISVPGKQDSPREWAPR